MVFIVAILTAFLISWKDIHNLWKITKGSDKFIFPATLLFGSVGIAFLLGWIVFGLYPCSERVVIVDEMRYETNDSIPIFTLQNHTISGKELDSFSKKFYSFETSNGVNIQFSTDLHIEQCDTIPNNVVKFVKCRTYKKEKFPKNLDKVLWFFSMNDENGEHASLLDYDKITVFVNSNYNIRN